MTLEEMYYEINRILGNNAEPLESVRLVEAYRRYLKPETVRSCFSRNRTCSLPTRTAGSPFHLSTACRGIPRSMRDSCTVLATAKGN